MLCKIINRIRIRQVKTKIRWKMIDIRKWLIFNFEIKTKDKIGLQIFNA